MIEREEIEAKAGEFDIHTSNVQRDYVFGWLLKGISENSYLGQALILKGGNALRKCYFEATRFSSDLDFSSLNKIDVDRIVSELEVVCRAISLQSGIKFQTDRTKLERGRYIDCLLYTSPSPRD